MYSYELLFCETYPDIQIQLLDVEIVSIVSSRPLPYHPTLLELEYCLSKDDFERIDDLLEEGLDLILCDTKIVNCLSTYYLNSNLELIPTQLYFEFESATKW